MIVALCIAAAAAAVVATGVSGATHKATAGPRVVIYRTDLFAKAGIKKAPTSLSELIADGKKLAATAGKKDRTFSPFYVAGQDWYSALAFVYDYGGRIAKTSKGQWVGTLDEPAALRGL